MTFTPKPLSTLTAAIALCSSSAVLAQSPTTPQSRSEDAIKMEEMVVYGSIGYRDRSDDVAPKLEYDRQYFERFEPASAGDALKRVPSVTFLSDVTESDGARLRGLNPGYTQILINGERVPGIGNDRSFLLDRIPAELIERVEVVRSSSAERPSDGIAGAINIVLRDSYNVDGTYLKVGGNYIDGDKWKENLAVVWGGEVGPGRLVLGIDRQGRYNPKFKESWRYEDSPENNPNYREEEFDNREDQTDVRDSTDTAFNLDYVTSFADDSNLRLAGVLVKTERTEDERSFEYDDLTAITGPLNSGGNLLTDNQQHQDIDETSYSFGITYSRPQLGGESKVKLTAAAFDSAIDDSESEIDFGDDIGEIEEERALQEVDDRESGVELSHRIALTDHMQMVFGGLLMSKQRDTLILEADADRDLVLDSQWNQFGDRAPLDVSNELTGLSPAAGGDNRIEEDRADIFLLLRGNPYALEWEIGVRYETTDVEIRDQAVDASSGLIDNDYDFFLPSAHLKYHLTDADRVMVSVSRTLRRPDFDLMMPTTLEGEVADNDLRGNPQMQPESAWGLDLGYERALGREGVVGVNLFYRDVSDKFELTNTGEEGSEGPGYFVYQADNIGDGWVSGIEFDISAPLSLLGLDSTGFFANYSYLDSEIEDIFGKRRFNSQSDHVYNVGVIQDLPRQDVSFGVTYRKQADAYERVLGEEVMTSYGADLEVFVEKRWQSVTLRAVGSNLLDSSKDETFNKFDTIEDQRNRDFDEYEIETEEAGPILRLTARMVF